MEAIIIVEFGSDGTYDVHTDASQNYPIGLLGQGNSIEDALGDFYRCEAEMKEYMNSIGKEFPFTSYKIVYDIPSSVGQNPIKSCR